VLVSVNRVRGERDYRPRRWKNESAIWRVAGSGSGGFRPGPGGR
jgi:hypothetical protein